MRVSYFLRTQSPTGKQGGVQATGSPSTTKMDSSDMDFRFMALNDLIIGIQSGTLTQKVLTCKLVQKAVRLLQDVNGEVQSLAVNAVSALFPVVVEGQHASIVEAVVAGMLCTDNERYKSVSVLALKSLVATTPPDNTGLISVLANYSIPTLIDSVNNDDSSIQIECCEILGDMVSRFGENLLPFHPNIVKCMFRALNGPQSSLRKRAVQMVMNFLSFEDTYASLLGFVKDRFEKVLNQAGLGMQSGQAQPSQQAEELTISYFKIALQCLVSLARNAECLASQASDLLCNGLLLHLLDSNINETIMPHLKRELGDFCLADAANELRELGLQCLDNLLRARQRTATQSSHLSRLLDTNFQKIAYVLAALVSYDPNCVPTSTAEMLTGSGDDDNSKDADKSMDYEDEGEEDDDIDVDDDEEEEEDDDTSWKVRRTAAKVMETCVQAYQEKLGHFYAYFAPVLISRLSEDRNEAARLEIFNCLNAMVRATTLKNPNSLTIRLGQQSSQSMLLRLLPGIFHNIQPFISTSSSKRSRSRMNSLCVKTTTASHQAVLALIRALAVALSGHLTTYLPTIVQMVKDDFSESSTPNSVKIDLIKLLHLIIETHEYDSYKELADTLNEITQSAILDPFYRVCYEGMDLAQILVQRKPLEHLTSMVPLFPALLNQLKVVKCDRDLKEKAMATVSTFIEQLGQDLTPECLQATLDQFTSFLDFETTRISAIRSLSIIFASPLSIRTCPVSRDLMKMLLKLMQSSNYDLRVAAIHCVTVICSQFPRDFILNGDKNVEVVLPLLPELLADPNSAVVQEALELAASVLKQCSRCDVVQQAMVADFYTTERFLQPVIALTHSQPHRTAQLTALLHLMQSIGMYRPETHMLSVKFMLEKVLGQLDDCTSVELSEKFLQIKGNLPNLARACAELILQLPRYGQLDSIDSTLEDMVDELKKKTTSYARRYVYIIIFGDVGYRIDISHRGDVFDVLMDHVVMNKSILPEAEQQTVPVVEDPKSSSSPVSPPSSTTATNSANSNNGFSDLRPLAAASLGRLIAGEPSGTVHELLQFFHQEYDQTLVHFYLFQTLRQAIINLVEVRSAEHIYRNVEEVWAIMMSHADHPEEGTRNAVAECLGRVTLLQPPELVPRLHAELKSPKSASSNTIRCTLVTAFKYLLSVAASINYPDDENSMASVSDTVNFVDASVTTLNDRRELVQTLLQDSRFLDVLAYILDGDADVCRAALITFNTAAHYWPTLIRPLFNAPIGPDQKPLVEEVYQCTTVRHELIREVQMGPFKVHFDDGVELRKTAYECMSTLLENYTDRLSMEAFLGPLIQGLKDNNHVKLAVCHILRRVILLAPIDVANKMPELSQALMTILQLQPKGDLVKRESEKLEEVKSCTLTVIAEFPKIPDIRKNQSYCELMRVIRSDKGLTSLWVDVVGSESSLMKV
ncbi:Cullin-associated NEDD8-dissociated protein 1 [Taenia crassiceps]|uniref:Cullin-associated NEDD8-dissociated protein 1 n=1 Tax=Taenia crassiceps TaxID=6207 RepID=A0ABR4Q7V0_9CEST